MWLPEAAADADYGGAMSALRRPRGPLPSRVYWARRITALGVALTLVTGLALVLRVVSDGEDDPAVTPSAGSQADLAAAPEAPATVTTTVTALPSGAAEDEVSSVEPEGTCENPDVVVSPIVYRAEAGRRSALVLELRTRETPACYWQASAGSLALKITRPPLREDRLPTEIWDTRRCPKAVPTRNLIVRRDQSVRIAVRWSGRRADAECSAAARWAYPGWYRLEVAALGGEPRELLFELRPPADLVVTRSPEPDPRPDGPGDAGQDAGDDAPDDPVESQDAAGEQQPTDEPLGEGSPSGAVEPNG